MRSKAKFYLLDWQAAVASLDYTVHSSGVATSCAPAVDMAEFIERGQVMANQASVAGEQTMTGSYHQGLVGGLRRVRSGSSADLSSFTDAVPPDYCWLSRETRLASVIGIESTDYFIVLDDHLSRNLNWGLPG